MKISVVTVCFNSENTIHRTFESIANQSDQDFEYIVVDGGSTDKTISLIKDFVENYKFKGRFSFVSEPDNGIYDAMNKGINMASGDYVGLLNSDDWYEPYVIQKVKDELKRTSDVDIFYGYIRILKNGVEYMVRRNNYDFILEGNGFIQHPTCFIKKAAYLHVGLYDTSYKICADQDLMLRMYKAGKKYKALDCVITNFALGGASDTVDSRNEVLKFKLVHGIISKRQYNKMKIFQFFLHIFKKIGF